MRSLALLLCLAPAFGQVRATYEPLAEAETKRATGVKTLTLWNVTVESTLPTINRGDVERLTPFTELRPSMAEDLIRKSSGANSLTLLGKAWDGGAGFVATGLGIVGYAAQSKEMALAGGAVAVVSMFRNLLKGQAPDGTMYLPEFMPDVMTCKNGYCGNFLVLTSKIGSPVRVEVGALTPLFSLKPSTEPMLLTESQFLFSRNQNTQEMQGFVDTPRSTHPQVDEPVIYDVARIAAMIREASARIGAVE